MAAKQGFSAQISQASEDAKRAVLNRTSLTNSLWFSNLNTTCTIKSAPPRTPDVLGLLSTKSGWLFKRNEQHVWQARYCCVVPHTFLYYFDAHPTNPCQIPTLTAKQQEILNKAVKQGYGKRGAAKSHLPRSSLYAVLGTGQNPTPPTADGEVTDQAQSTLQPAGIIDLECYTTVHRNNQNQLVMELAGDETVNPDLRSFYFCANNEDEGEEWSQALLGNRHSSLVDEKEAYRQVCDGFAQQLQVLHSELENEQAQAETKQEELYRVRSQMEDTRRSCMRLVQDALERGEGTVPARRAYRTDLETIQAQDLGVLPAVQLLCDYTRVLEETCRDSSEKINEMEQQMQTKQAGDTSRVQELEDELSRVKAEMKQQRATWQSQLDTLTQKYIQSQKDHQDVQKDLASQRMELTMHQSSTRTKMGELQSHKKILKKEVIELRKKLEEAHSQLDLFKHKESSVKLEAEQERQKAILLQRYVEKIESQVKVQQNVMEMMSAAGSQYGGGGASLYGGTGDASNFQHMDVQVPSAQVIVNTPSSVQQEGDDDDDDEDDDGEEEPQMVPVNLSSRRPTNRRVIDDDNKSHMSELTEDRTQRHFDAAYYIHQQQQKENAQQYRAMGASPRNMQHHALMGGPPSIIIGGVSEERSVKDTMSSQPKLDTIMSTHSSTRPRADVSRFNEAAPPKPQTPRRDNDNVSVTSLGSKSKMSVAQRARIEADRQTTPVRVRPNPNHNNTTPLRGSSSGTPRKDQAPPLTSGNLAANNAASGNSVSGNSFFSNLGRRLENAIDNAVLGDIGSDYESSYVSTDIGSNVDLSKLVDRNKDADKHDDEKKSGETGSEASTNLSLAERQALQRAQQLKFLKDQGLINKESDVTGGAGKRSSPKVDNDGTSSVASFGSFMRRAEERQ
eukprot:Nitzschia sp. Nitz4//scaffold19_size178191//41830//44605//NITZ4_001962-RA/size178191-augustus-gene-0.46-mRNA-1//1//CDS//3329540634//8102//frame0